ncbi:hypothetical protein AAH446_16125 [Erwinia sp. P6884]|uniref:hypothetical protein n=1 Tax=Erwinia sp. P6884 TaxID=3141450 RepID=UPI003188CC7B
MALKRRELPRYKGKETQVLALKIKEVKQAVDGTGVIVPVDEFYPEFDVSHEYMSINKPEKGGYYVESIDGQPMYMEAKEFSSEYSLMK